MFNNISHQQSVSKALSLSDKAEVLLLLYAGSGSTGGSTFTDCFMSQTHNGFSGFTQAELNIRSKVQTWQISLKIQEFFNDLCGRDAH